MNKLQGLADVLALYIVLNIAIELGVLVYTSY